MPLKTGIFPSDLYDAAALLYSTSFPVTRRHCQDDFSSSSRINYRLMISLLLVYVWFYSVGNMESPSAVNWLSSTRLYMIIRASAGYGWVNNFQHPLSAVIIKQASLWSLWRWDNQLPLSTSYVVSGAYGIKNNVLINYTSILVRKCMESVMCEIKSLLIVTLEYFSFCDRKWRRRTTITLLNSRGSNRSSSEWASMAGSFLSSSG